MPQLTHRSKGGNKQGNGDCQFFHGFPFEFRDTACSQPHLLRLFLAPWWTSLRFTCVIRFGGLPRRLPSTGDPFQHQDLLCSGSVRAFRSQKNESRPQSCLTSGHALKP
jgi:hypothetical protein